MNENNDMTKQLEMYVETLKQKAKKGTHAFSKEMNEIAQDMSDMIEHYKNQEEVEQLQKDVKKTVNQLGKNTKKVVEDIKDVIDD